MLKYCAGSTVGNVSSLFQVTPQECYFCIENIATFSPMISKALYVKYSAS
jgi:hypothetical protein